MKKSLLLLSVIFFISAAGAYNFGTFTYQDSKQVTDRNVSFEIGMINPENSELTVALSSQGLENGRTVFPENNFVLRPSEVSSSPTGDGWISVETGKYVKVKKVRFWVLMDEKIDENFQIRIRAQKSGQDNSGIRPKAVQLRDYSYSIEYPKEEKNTVSRGYDRETGLDKGLEIIRSYDEEAHNSSSSSEENLTIEGSDENVSKTSKTSDNSTSNQGDGISSTTLLLSAGAVGSLIYLWMVV